MSRFVSAGTDESPTERDEAWLRAQQEIEAKHQRKLDEGQQQDGKSLYETLQANKAAKQDAFEESARLKNQFRALDEDEVEFLDSVMESTRKKEAEVNKQTKEELNAFRQQQEEAGKAANQQEDEQAEVTKTWAAGPRKRKKGRESTIGGVKIRRMSAAEKQADAAATKTGTADDPGGSDPRVEDGTKRVTSTKDIKSVLPPEDAKADSMVKSPSPTAVGLGLAAYSSDDDDD